jgi:hypothetical protein
MSCRPAGINLGTVGLDWQFSGIGNFSGTPGGSDLLLRNVNTGGLEVYNIANNQIIGAAKRAMTLMPPRGAAVTVRRKRKPSEFHSEVTRERIRAGVIIDRFQKHFMGELELTPTQIRVGEILLRKVIPDLTHTDLSATFTRRYVVEVPAQLSDEEWEKKYSLPAPALNSVQ